MADEAEAGTNRKKKFWYYLVVCSSIFIFFLLLAVLMGAEMDVKLELRSSWEVNFNDIEDTTATEDVFQSTREDFTDSGISATKDSQHFKTSKETVIAKHERTQYSSLTTTSTESTTGNDITASDATTTSSSLEDEITRKSLLEDIFVIGKTFNYSDAEKQCRQNGGTLLILQSTREENEFIQKSSSIPHLRGCIEALLGLRKIQDEIWRDPHGEGTVFTVGYTKVWAESNNHYANEECIELSVKEHEVQLSNYNCNSLRYCSLCNIDGCEDISAECTSVLINRNGFTYEGAYKYCEESGKYLLSLFNLNQTRTVKELLSPKQMEACSRIVIEGRSNMYGPYEDIQERRITYKLQHFHKENVRDFSDNCVAYSKDFHSFVSHGCEERGCPICRRV